MPRYIDADALLNNTDGLEHVKYSQEYGHVVLVCDIIYAPTTEVVPWAFLERYAEFFCADVPYTEFVREAKLFWEGENCEREETEDE